MQRLSIYFPALLLLLASLCGCRREDEIVLPGEASLHLELRLPGEYSPGTRSGYADGDVSEAVVDGSAWSDWERLVDGQRIYRLTLLLIRKSDNTLVGYRDLYENTSDYQADETIGINGFCASDGSLLPASTRYAKSARATFIYNHPLHSGAEKFIPGEYRLMAVANYSPVSGVDDNGIGKSYGGLQDQGTPFHTTVNTILEAFEASPAGIPFTASDYPDFFGAEVHTVRSDSGTASYTAGDEQYVCEQRPQPLSLVKDFTLFSGENSISGEMVRTYSRIRFSLENTSSTNRLSFDGFSLTDSGGAPLFTAQKSIFLFDDGTDSSFTSFGADAGVPVVDSPFAIHPWTGAVTLAERSGEQVFFDAYVLESRRGADKYAYALDLGYKDLDNQYLVLAKTEYQLNLTPIDADLDVFNDLIDDGKDLFVLRFPRPDLKRNRFAVAFATEQYLRQSRHSDNTDNPKPASMDDIPARLNESGGPKYIWRFSRSGDLFLIQNLFSENYVGTAVGGVGKDPVSIDPVGHRFKVGTHTNTYTGFYIQDGEVGNASSNNCWNDFSEKGELVGYWKYDDPGSILYFYHVTENQVIVGDTHFDDKVTLSLIDSGTSAPYDALEIRRNDYIRVRITVSYFADDAFFRFIVNPWGRKDENLEFD